MSNDLGRIETLGADAVGMPGQRRFRLYARSGLGSAVVWMEKEHLRTLAETLEGILGVIADGEVLRLEARPGGLPSPTGMPGDFPLTPTYDFQVGQMKLNFDEHNEMFLLSLAPMEIIEERGEPQALILEDEAVVLRFSPQEALELSNEIGLVVAAGRPVCPFCHMPLDGGPHACVKQNGHHKIVQMEIQDIDEDEEE
ncbi:DUF3090 family protein [Ktedonobacter racemifer]|uniref:DUF3090 family protein n=1 Tax=Ktedonobacter racemifer DSM 44963 TaxID=485913 RepID=D6TN14_KTERA|nr:DUF3090 family protein [Ktedonobacter racemifer]EFH87164.1 conserved hypothetical protein [Ktedonobacter racemifer DSM 44963]